MTHISNSTTRPYRSELRADQARGTRERILDAAGRVIADGFASVSIPAVAREADVSIPTVYRHFRTRRQLLQAIYPHMLQRAGLGEPPAPTSLEDLHEGLRSLYDRLESFGDLDRAAMASPAAEDVRHVSMPRRIGMTRRFADNVAPELPPGDRDRIARLLVILTTSGTARILRDHLDRSVDEAVADVEWMIRSVVAGAAAGAGPGGSRRGRRTARRASAGAGG